MVTSMATTKVTITLPDSQLDEIRERVAAHESSSVSGFVQHAIQQSLDNDAEFRTLVHQTLMESGGPVTTKERAWARKMLAGRKRNKPPKRRSAA